MFYYRQCPEGSVPYTVREGDTLKEIALEYGVSIQDIISVNPGINPRLLAIGQQICVPERLQTYPMCSTSNYYVVVKGDTLKSIAEYFNISPLQLLYSNYGINPYELYIDQILCIPIAPSPVFVDINLAEQRLNVYRNGLLLKTYGISIDNPSIPMPMGTFNVINKQLDTGLEYGARWIGLSEAGCGIRGTNTPAFIKAAATGNNIVMTNKDASELFNLVPVGTTVRIV